MMSYSLTNTGLNCDFNFGHYQKRLHSLCIIQQFSQVHFITYQKPIPVFQSSYAAHLHVNGKYRHVNQLNRILLKTNRMLLLSLSSYQGGLLKAGKQPKNTGHTYKLNLAYTLCGNISMSKSQVFGAKPVSQTVELCQKMHSLELTCLSCRTLIASYLQFVLKSTQLPFFNFLSWKHAFRANFLH